MRSALVRALHPKIYNDSVNPSLKGVRSFHAVTWDLSHLFQAPIVTRRQCKSYSILFHLLVYFLCWYGKRSSNVDLLLVERDQRFGAIAIETLGRRIQFINLPLFYFRSIGKALEESSTRQRIQNPDVESPDRSGFFWLHKVRLPLSAFECIIKVEHSIVCERKISLPENSLFQRNWNFGNLIFL